MAGILRSSKCYRYFTSFTRNIFSNTSNTNGSFVQHIQCLSSTSLVSKASSMAAVKPQIGETSTDSILEKSLRRLDNDVRRSGRISCRELENILEELLQSRSATSSQSLLIIRCCGNLVPEESPTVRTKLVQEIWNTLEGLGVEMDVSHYNALLRVYLENEHTFSPTQFLAQLASKGIEPNRVTYQRLISHYCQQADIDGATQILEFMREKQLPVNESVFNALIMGHGQANDMQSATGILNVMKQAGLEPSADTYTTLLCGYAKQGDIGTISTLLEECKSKDIYLLDKDMMDIVYALAAHNHNQYIPQIIDGMQHTIGYNQDAMHLILRLININQIDDAYLMLKTMQRPLLPDGQPTAVGAFFIRQLVKSEQALDRILVICNDMEKTGLNSRALLIASERSLQLGNIDQAFALLNAMQGQSLPIRQHYFWPLLANVAQKKDVDGILKILERMDAEFKLSPGGETLRERVLPLMPSTLSSDEVISKLRGAGVSPASAACAVVSHYVSQNNLSTAAHVACHYRAQYPVGLLRRPMTLALIRSKDVISYISLLRQLTQPNEQLGTTDVVGNLVIDVASLDRTDITEQLLKGLINEGLSISNSSGMLLHERMARTPNSNVLNLIDQLTAGDLVAQPLPSNNNSSFTRLTQLDAANLEKLKLTLESNGQSTIAVRKQLLSAYCRVRDLNNVNRMVESLDGDKFIYTGGTAAQLIELYAHHGMLEQALRFYQMIKKREPDFVLDQTKIIRLATLLVKNDQISNAIDLLNESKQPPADQNKLGQTTFGLTSLCWQLLNILAEAGKVEELKTVFNSIVEHHHVPVSNVLLGPLVKVHIVREDLASAMMEFESCCLSHRSTPWKNELACKLILAEDALALQKLTDLSTGIHGEVNSLYDLVFAFVECGRVRQAKKILETPGLGSRPQRIVSACDRFRQEGLVAPLEGLIDATKDIAHIVDRSHLYTQLLHSYCESNEADKAIALWTRMQDENIAISDEFLIMLGKLLNANNMKIPFVIPATIDPKALQKESQQHVNKSKLVAPKLPTELEQFRQALKDGLLEAAVDAKQRCLEREVEVTVTDISNLIELSIKNDQLQSASNLAMALFEKKQCPVPRVFRFLLNRLANAGNVAQIEGFEAFLSKKDKKLFSFDNRLCYANVVSGKAQEYLNVLEKEINESNENDVARLAEKFPKGGAISILQQAPHLIGQFEEMSRSYAVRGVTFPINVLWMHLFINGEDSKAGQLWCEFLSSAEQVMFQHIVQTARKNEDEQLATRLVNQLVGTGVGDGGVGNAYSCLIDILVAKGKMDEAGSALEGALKNISLANINSTSLARLTNGLKSEGKSIPHIVPNKSNTDNLKISSSSSDSSSSDSDNEATKHS